MGFWGSLWNGVKKVAETAAVIVSAPIIIPAALAYGAAEKLGLTSSGSEKISQAEVITESSNARQVDNIATILEELNDKYRNVCIENEKLFQKYVNEFFEEIMGNIRQNDAIAKDFGTERLEHAQKLLCRQIRGSMTRKIDLELSLDNATIRRILSSSDKRQRKIEYKRYADSVLLSAQQEIVRRCSSVLNQQMEEIDKFLQSYVDAQNKKAERMKNNFAEMEKAMMDNTFDYEKSQLKPKEKLYAIRKIQKILAA